MCYTEKAEQAQQACVCLQRWSLRAHVLQHLGCSPVHRRQLQPTPPEHLLTPPLALNYVGMATSSILQGLSMRVGHPEPKCRESRHRPDACVTRGKQHRPGIAPNANTTHVPTAGSSAAPTIGLMHVYVATRRIFQLKGGGISCECIGIGFGDTQAFCLWCCAAQTASSASPLAQPARLYCSWASQRAALPEKIWW